MSEVSSSVAVEVIAAFGGLSAAARALGHKHVSTVQGWQESGRIPSWRRPEIVAAAKIAKVTLPPAFLNETPQADPEPAAATTGQDAA